MTTVILETENLTDRRGPLGRFMRVPKELCFLNTKYQREPAQGKVARIAKHFNWAIFGVIVGVMDDSGRIAIVDGGHRWKAAMLLDDVTTLPVRVFEGYDATEQARLFIAANRARTQMAPVQLFKAMLAACDTKAVSIETVLRRYGITVPANACPAKKDICTCPVSLLDWKIDDLEAVVSFVTHAWPEDDNRMRVEVLKGVRFFLFVIRKHGKDLGDADIIRKFRNSSLVGLRQEALGLCSFGGATRDRAMCMALVNHYNQKRRGGRLSMPINGQE